MAISFWRAERVQAKPFAILEDTMKKKIEVDSFLQFQFVSNPTFSPDGKKADAYGTFFEKLTLMLEK